MGVANLDSTDSEWDAIIRWAKKTVIERASVIHSQTGSLAVVARKIIVGCSKDQL